ncbi:SAM-dependent methyltransferase [Salipaludibacillus neizhouensis]|uniref:SAM-dependent methyltransferase n=1 Tax=Salipaludibacillus neizhouensis TaxID=885475 RepID=A0A3A9KI74_9BACI|nr:class I SAM-dependent methyltransferase [Salipaludibacillus neizhouensis]RKL64666.1 SAM-dependent methyltransferase [Salipaludibacillus neizhouensis]
MDPLKQNSDAWDKKVEDGAVYTKPINEEIIKKSKDGYWGIRTTPTKYVPREWLPKSLEGQKILCLASGGGQQGPVLAAAGADVTVVDLSAKQLDQDKFVSERDGLKITTIQGSMTDLHFFDDQQFDIIVHPVSNLFVENLSPVWKEASRVLKDNGVLIAGFTNPLLFIFDDKEDMKGNLVVKNSIPSTSLDNLTERESEEYLKAKNPIEFGHTLEDQIQGQINAGFVITGLYEDDFGGSRPLDKYIKCFISTKARKVDIVEQ